MKKKSIGKGNDTGSKKTCFSSNNMRMPKCTLKA